ncbi:MAG TPA: pseudouridine synthase, partial [Polyangiaceae bacterium]|nr:pseudouridine synthase [Polyangiaceae bacterium]
MTNGQQPFVEESPAATPPSAAVSCVHAERCGGCPLIALPYTDQLAAKRARVSDALCPYPSLASVLVQPIAAADRIEQYRIRAKLVVGAPARIGLYTGPGHELVDIPGCRVLSPALLAASETLRALLRKPPAESGAALLAYTRRGQGALCAVDLRETRAEEHARVLVTLIVARERPLVRSELVQAARALSDACPQIAGVAVSYRAASAVQLLGSEPELLIGSAHTLDRIGGHLHEASFGSFVQTHREQAGKLHSHVVQELGSALGGLPSRHVLELYAGSGAMGFSLAAAGARVTLAEQRRPAAKAAQASAVLHGSDRIVTLHGDAAETAERLAASGQRFDAVLVNPPRRGISPRARAAIAALAPRAIAYVSCNPLTLARDLDAWTRLGFAAARIQPLDMMPLTEEVESFALLVPRAEPSPRILFEDEELLVVDKPAHESTTPQGERSGSLLERVRSLPGANEAVPIHRLDAETSGVCLFAKHPRFVAAAARLLTDGEKRYVALVRGLTSTKGVVNRPLREAGAEIRARTRYRRLSIAGGHSLVAVLPDQGRKHQIRRHLA